LDILVGTILSQNTNDRNSHRAYERLKKRYASWEEVAALTPSKLEREIKTAGLGKQKSKAILGALRRVIKERGEASLDYLREMDDAALVDHLVTFEGVAEKTASCVALFSLGRNVCPVDTHVHRTLNRIGAVETKSPTQTYAALAGNIPEGAAHRFHTNLIRLGRELCKPAKPLCGACPVKKRCRHEPKRLESAPAPKTNDFFLLDAI
jgi:endonuclease-3